MAKLSQQQLLFVDYYAKSGNAPESAISAGYSKKSAYSMASRLLKKVEIQAALAKLNNDLAIKTNWSREDSIRTLLQVIAKPDKKSDITTSIKILNEMQGFNQPVKIEHSGAIGLIKRILVDPKAPTPTEGAK